MKMINIVIAIAVILTIAFSLLCLFYKEEYIKELKKYNETIEGELIEAYRSLEVSVDMRNKTIELNEGLLDRLYKYREIVRHTYDYEVLAKLIYAEAGNQPFEVKQKVASVVFNRIKEEKFKDQDTIMDVMTAPGQFTPMGKGYVYDIEPTEECYLAIEEAIINDNSDGALFFISPKTANHLSYFNSLKLVYEGKDMNFYKYPEGDK